MKQAILIALLVLATSAHAADWTQIDHALYMAELAWNVTSAQADIAGIRFDSDPASFSSCGAGDKVAWADLAARTIRLNPICHWDQRRLTLVLTHELGHLLTSSSAHSPNRHSIMYTCPLLHPSWMVFDRQHITTEDRQRFREAQERERPTIMSAGAEGTRLR